MPCASLMVRRMPLKKVLTFFLEGLMSSFPLGYLRTLYPRKSKPCSTCVMTVFVGESSRPRSCKNCSTRGLISPSSNSFDLLVMTKSGNLCCAGLIRMRGLMFSIETITHLVGVDQLPNPRQMMIVMLRDKMQMVHEPHWRLQTRVRNSSTK